MITVQILPTIGKFAVFQKLKAKEYFVERVEFLRFTTEVTEYETEATDKFTHIDAITATDITDGSTSDDSDFIETIVDELALNDFLKRLLDKGYKKG